jgi:hypothetical protein
MPTWSKRWPLLALGVLGCNAVLGLDDRTLVDAGAAASASSGSSGSASAGSVAQSGTSSGGTSGVNTSGSLSSTGAIMAGSGLAAAGTSGAAASGSVGGTGGMTGSGAMVPSGASGSSVGTTGAVSATGSISGSGATAGSGSTTSSGSTSVSGTASGSMSGASSGAGTGAACLTTTALPLMSAVASSNEGETDAGTGGVNPAAGAVDGVLSTRWGSAFPSAMEVDPSWVYADFGAEVSLAEVDILWQSACATAYDIQLSNDAMTWTTIKSVTTAPPTWANPPTGWTNDDVQTALSGVGRYFRIYGIARCLADYGYSIWEMRAFGDTNASCTSGSASGSTSGTTSGSTSGSTSGTASGSSSGTPVAMTGSPVGTSNPTGCIVGTYEGTDTCTAGCTTASATCPAQSCYVVSAVPAAAAGLDGIANDKLLPQYAVDGNTATSFRDGQAQMGGEYFQIDLCQPEYVNGVTINDTVDTTDVATAFEVNVSLDGNCWTTVFNSQTQAATLEVVTFPSVLARFVRYEQTGNDVNNPAPWFAIDEITVQCGP